MLAAIASGRYVHTGVHGFLRVLRRLDSLRREQSLAILRCSSSKI